MSGVSEEQLGVLVTDLEPTDLVRALRGTSGRHVLTRDPSTITALDVMFVLEGETAPADGVVDVPARHHWSRRAARSVEV
jgi:Rrf2 family cysteine metabolism transcriptional repressor